jgi:hypothetical protein
LWLTFGCATQQSPRSPQASPASTTTATAASTSPGSTTTAPAQQAKPKPVEPKTPEEATSALEASLASLKEAVVAIGAKNANAASFERARAEVAKLEQLLADGKPVEGASADYAMRAQQARAELDKDKAAIEARWQQLGVGLSRSALDDSVKQVTLASRGADFTKTEAAIKEMSARIDNASAFEAKDPKFAQFATQKKQQLAAFQKALEAQKQKAATAAQLDKVNKAKVEAEKAIAQLRTHLEESAFDAAKSALAALEEALQAGKPIEDKDPAYAKAVAAVRATVDRDKAQIEAQRAHQKAELHKQTVEAGRKKAAEAVKALAGATEGFDAAEKVIAELEAAVQGGKDLAAADKTYAPYLATVGKEVLGHRATIVRLRQQAAVLADRKGVDAAAAEVQTRLDALKKSPDAESMAAADKAIAQLEKVLKDGEAVAAKDKQHAAYLAGVQKKLTLARAEHSRAVKAKKIVDHRASVQAEKAKVDQALEGLAGKLDQPLYQAAEDAITAMEKVIASGEELGADDPKYKAELKSLTDKVPVMRMTIKKRFVEAANVAVVEKLKALEGDADPGAISAAKDAVRVLGNTVQAAKSLDTKDKAYLQYVAAMETQVAAYGGKIEQLRVGGKLKKHKASVESALAVENEKMQSLTSENPAFDAAEGAVLGLKSVLESTDDEMLSDKAYRAYLEGLKKKIDADNAQIQKRRLEVAVLAHKKSVAAAEGAVTERLKALAREASEGAFGAAEESIAALEKAVADPQGADKDPKYAKELALAKARVAPYRAAIERRKVEAAVAAHRTKVEAAQEAAQKSLSGGDLDEADRSIAALEQAIGEGDALAAKDQKHASYLGALKKKIPEERALLAKKRTDQKVAAHRATVADQKAKLAEKMKALEGKVEEPPYQAAEAAVGEVSNAIGTGDDLASEDPKYGKELKAEKDAVLSTRLQIRRRFVEAVQSAAAERIKALSGAPDDAAFTSAEEAVAAVGKAVGTAKKVESKDKAYLAFVAAAEKQVPAQQNSIKQRRAQLALAKHRAHVAELSAKAAEAVKSVDKEGGFDAAEAAVLELENSLKSDDPAVSGDPKYGKEAAQIRTKAAGYHAAIEKQRFAKQLDKQAGELTDAQKAAADALGALKGKIDPAQDKAAEESIAKLEVAVESGAALGKKDAAYAKRLALVRKEIAADRARLEKERVRSVVDSHKAELEAAQKTLSEKLEALKGTPDAPAFEAAEAAVTGLKTAIDSGAEAGKKDAGYAKRLAALDKKIGEYRATIAQRRFDADVRDQRAKVSAAAKAVSEKLEALAGKPEAAAFSAAEESVAQLEAALAEGKPFAEKNKLYDKELGAERKKIAGFKSRITKRRFEVERDEYRAQLDAAAKSLADSIKALAKSSDAAAPDQAEQSLGALIKQIHEGQRFTKEDKKLQARLVSLNKEVPKDKTAIATARFDLSVKAHKESVEKDAQEVDKRIEALGGGATADAIKSAKDGVDELENTVKAGAAMAKKNKAHGKWLAPYGKRIASYRSTIGRKAVEGEVKAHRAEVEAARAEVNEKLKGLEGQLEYTLYQAAEGSMTKMKKVVDQGASLGEKDDSYGRELAKASAEVEQDRLQMRRTWVGAADAAVADKLKAVQVAQPDDNAWREVESAFRVLVNTIESGRELSKDKAYLKFIAASEKKALGYRSKIDRRRSETEFGGVRADLDQAVKDSSAKMSAADKQPSPEAFEAAQSALQALENAIDANGPAAEKDKAHKKRLDALKKKVAADRTKLERLKTTAESKSQLDRETTAEAAFTKCMAAVKGRPDAAALDAADEAITELDSAIADTKPVADENKKYKKHVLDLQRKLTAARTMIKTKRLDAKVIEQRVQVQAAIKAAKQKVAAIGKDAEDEAFSGAEDAVKEVTGAIAAGKDVAKKDKKFAAYLVNAKKTERDLSTAIQKKRAAKGADAEAKTQSSVADAWSSFMKKAKALGKTPSSDDLDAAIQSADEVQQALDEAEGSKEGKTAKYKKYAAVIKKKLKTERAKLKKLKGRQKSNRS